MPLLFVFQSPHGCSLNSSLTGWSQRLKLVKLMMWSDDLDPPISHDPVSHYDTHLHPQQPLFTLQLCINIYANIVMCCLFSKYYQTAGLIIIC